jgi:hypothetical protein
MAAAAAAVAAVAAPVAAAPAAASSPDKKESVAVAMETAQKGVPEQVLDAKIQGSVLRTELENGIRAIRSMTDAQFYDFGIACKDWIEKKGMQIWPDPVVFASSKQKLPTDYSVLYNTTNNNNNNMNGPTRGGAGGPPPGRKSRKNRKGRKSRKGIKSRKNNRKHYRLESN